MHRKGIHAFEEPNVSEAAEYRVRGLSRGLLGLPGGSADKESAYNAGDPGSIPRLKRSAGEGIDYPLQYSGFPW